MLTATEQQLEPQFDQYRRTYNDTSTWFAEVLNGSMRTPFEYTFDGNELHADDGSRLGPIFENAIIDAERTARTQPSLAFEVRRRRIEHEEYQEMLALADGDTPNTMVVVSDFPPELIDATRDVGGYNTERRQTMLRVIARNNAGRLVMYSQSLDGSDRTALEAMYADLGYTPAPGELLGQRMHVDVPEEDHNYFVDQLMGVYDRTLAVQHGRPYYAGQPIAEHTTRLNTYAFALQQHDLIDDVVMRSMQGTITNDRLYGVVALLERRFEAVRRQPATTTKSEQRVSLGGAAIQRQIFEEAIRQASIEAGANGKVFSGCGLSLAAGGDGVSSLSATEQLQSAGYGNKHDEDKYGSLEFKCPNGHTNRRPAGKLMESCRHCGVSVRC